MGDELEPGGERRDEGLRGGDALLLARMQRQHDLAGGGERRGGVVHERHRQRAVVTPGLGEVENVRAAARLRHGEEERIAHARARLIDGGHGGTDGGRHEAGMDLEQIFDEGRRVVRAAARAGDGKGRRRRAQALAELAAQGRVALDEARDDLRRFLRLAQHTCFEVQSL